MKWKLVVFETDPIECARPTTYYTPEKTIESYKEKILDIIGDPENAQIVWDDLSRIGARYAEWPHATFVLISWED